MHALTPRLWIVAGAALVGAGAIAATPIAAPLPALPALQSRATQLTADFDPFGAWQDVLGTAKTNATTLSDAFSAAPFVAQQQEIANQVGYLQDLFNGSATIGDIFGHIKDNATDAFQAATFSGLTFDPLDPTTTAPLLYSNDAFHSLLVMVLPQYLPQDENSGLISEVVQFMASPLSGVLIGALGPSISPWIALGNSFTEISDALSGDNADWTTALQEMADIPANMAGGFLNGATLDLDALLPMLADSGLFPEGITMDSLSYAFGGLLSTGETAGHVGGSIDGSEIGFGGSMLNGLGINLDLGFPLDIAGQGVGPLAAWESLSQIMAGALGWDGLGSPLDDLFGSGTAAGSDLLAELASSFGL